MISLGRDAYLVHLLVWTLPLVLAQLGALLWRFRGAAGEVLRGVLPPALLSTVWLSVGDHFAISAGVWRFGAGKHLGIYVGAVPLEEVLFFLLTNLLVAFGLALFATMRKAGPT